MPPPTEEDLAYLKKVGALPSFMSLDSLRWIDSVSDKNLDDEGLAHVARLYDLEWLSLGREAGSEQTITDAGLAHLE